MRPEAAALWAGLALASCSLADSAGDESRAPGTATEPATSKGAASAPSPLVDLEHPPVLDDLGIAAWDQFQPDRHFQMGFERPDEADPSYLTPQSDTTRHERGRALAHSGSWGYTGWLTGSPPVTPEIDGPNHRGYPTVQFGKMGRDSCHSPCLIDMWVWLDVSLVPDQWFSLATFAFDPTDAWSRVVTVNMGGEGELSLFHVPDHGVGDRVFQTENMFPLRQWVRVTTFLDTRIGRGAAAVWQDGRLTSAARVSGGDEALAQAHFGLYAPPDLLNGRVVNDDIAFWRL